MPLFLSIGKILIKCIILTDSSNFSFLFSFKRGLKAERNLVLVSSFFADAISGITLLIVLNISGEIGGSPLLLLLLSFK